MDASVAAIRGPRYPAPETVTARRAAAREADGARVVPMRPQPQPTRDGARRHGAIVPLDGQHRASLGKPLTAMGGTCATPLVAVLRGGHAVVTVREGGGSPATVALTVDADKRLVGIITTRDLLSEDDDAKPVTQVMHRDVVSAAPETTSDEAMAILHAQRIEKLPLVDPRGRVVGLITQKDLMKNEQFPKATKDSRGRLAVGRGM